MIWSPIISPAVPETSTVAGISAAVVVVVAGSVVEVVVAVVVVVGLDVDIGSAIVVVGSSVVGSSVIGSCVVGSSVVGSEVASVVGAASSVGELVVAEIVVGGVVTALVAVVLVVPAGAIDVETVGAVVDEGAKPSPISSPVAGLTRATESIMAKAAERKLIERVRRDIP